MEKYDIIGDVRGGHGLMTAIEMVSDRATKAPIDGNSALAVQEGAYQNGAMVRVSGPNLILSPPLVLSEAEARYDPVRIGCGARLRLSLGALAKLGLTIVVAQMPRPAKQDGALAVTL